MTARAYDKAARGGDPEPTGSGAGWLMLGLLTAVEFLVFLDLAIVNIALPSMQADLDLSPSEIAWVIGAYQIFFGGFLLLGGRAGDVVGHRRVYLTGLLLFTGASATAGLAGSGDVVIAARALQGLGAAALVPSALALLNSAYRGTARHGRAFGVWGAMRSAGASAGVAIGGIVTQLAGWPWIFLINVPIGLGVLIVAWRVLPAGPVQAGRHLDAAGAVTVTGGVLLVALVLGEGSSPFWTSPGRTALLLVGIALLAALPLVERRRADPLLPVRLLRDRLTVTANVVSFLVGAAHLALFYLLSLYLQEALGYTPLQAGFAVLPIGLVVVANSTLVVSRVLSAWGPRRLLISGMGLLAAALLWLGTSPFGSDYLVGILPAGLLTGLGLPAAFVGVTVLALDAGGKRDAGVASALVNTTQRLGGGLGAALATAVAVTGPSVGFTEPGLRHGFLVAAALAAAGALVAWAAIPRTLSPSA